MTETPELLREEISRIIRCTVMGSTETASGVSGEYDAADAILALTRVPPSTVGVEASKQQIESVARAIMMVFIKHWFQNDAYHGPVYLDCVNGEMGWLEEAKAAIAALSPTLASEKEGGKVDLAKVQAAADEVVSRVAEWDDRTSPEDFPEAGKRVLVAEAGFWMAVARYVPAHSAWIETEASGLRLNPPTHWMPLPAMPLTDDQHQDAK